MKDEEKSHTVSKTHVSVEAPRTCFSSKFFCITTPQVFFSEDFCRRVLKACCQTSAWWPGNVSLHVSMLAEFVARA